MLNSSIRLGKLAGVEIGINISLIFIAALLTFSMADGYYRYRVPSGSQTIHLMLGGFTALFFFASILWHEMAHALMAKFFNVPVKRIVLFIFGGMAEIEEEPRQPSHEFWISLIGPISSVVLGGIFLGMGYVLNGESASLSSMFTWLGRINLLLAVFNMIPGFPLDGGRVLRAVIWYFSGNFLKATRVAVAGGQFFALLFVLFGIFEVMRSGDIFGGFWMLFIAWFLWSAARSYLENATLQHALRDIPITRALAARVELSPDWTLVYALDKLAIHGSPPIASVVQDNQTVGVFNLESVLSVPRISWGTVRVGNLMRSLANIPAVSADMDVFNALRQMERTKADCIQVKNGVHFVGIIGQRELVRFVQRHRKLITAPGTPA